MRGESEKGFPGKYDQRPAYMKECSNLGRESMTFNGVVSVQIARNAVICREDQICMPTSPKQLHLYRTFGQYTISVIYFTRTQTLCEQEDYVPRSNA